MQYTLLQSEAKSVHKKQWDWFELDAGFEVSESTALNETIDKNKNRVGFRKYLTKQYYVGL